MWGRISRPARLMGIWKWRQLVGMHVFRISPDSFTPPPNPSPNRGGGTCTEDQESPSPQAGRGWGGVKLCGLFRRLTTQWSASYRPSSFHDAVCTRLCSTGLALCICVHTLVGCRTHSSSSLHQAHIAATKWLVWVVSVRVGDWASEAFCFSERYPKGTMWYSSTFHRF